MSTTTEPSTTPERFIHIMVDIETLDTEESAVILSIGACTIPPSTAQFYVEPTRESQHGRSRSKSTLLWWESQPPELYPLGNTGPLIDCLIGFSTWLRAFDATPVLWSKGIDFDSKILANAYRQYNLAPPWKYNNVRDFRTLKKTLKTDFIGVNALPHNALADAKHQTDQLMQMIAAHPTLTLS